MKSLSDGVSYNERLFSGSLRGRFHLARFKWVSSEVGKLRTPARSFLELGCFDGKLIEFLPTVPVRYAGFDANWEGGLDMAVKKWKMRKNYTFQEARTPEDMALTGKDRFDVAVAMETLEHVPPELVDGYLEKISQHLDGYFFITVPNEKGLVFLVKWTLKKLLSKDAHAYSLSEVVNATLGRMHRVKRNEHKGFDYAALTRQIGKHFDVVSVSGHPLALLPCWACFSIGIVAKAKAKKPAAV